MGARQELCGQAEPQSLHFQGGIIRCTAGDTGVPRAWLPPEKVSPVCFSTRWKQSPEQLRGAAGAHGPAEACCPELFQHLSCPWLGRRPAWRARCSGDVEPQARERPARTGAIREPPPSRVGAEAAVVWGDWMEMAGFRHEQERCEIKLSTPEA